MDFVKKHYEKVLLGVVLLGLVVAVALLYFKINSEKAELEQQRETRRPNPKELEEVNLGRGESTLKILEGKIVLDLGGAHNVVNPVMWMKGPDGKIFKQETGGGFGPAAVKVVRIDPLYLVVSYERTNVAGYEIAIERQAAAKASERARTTRTVNVNDRRDSTTLFTLLDVKKDPAGNPVELVLEMVDSGKKITLNPPNAYKEVAGYKTTLRYPPENNREFRDCYRDSEIRIEGESYIVLPISETEVVLSAKPNGKKTTIHLESRSSAQ